jgi:hypothetical protein
MRRWVCIATLLAVFGGEVSGPTRARIRQPIPIERPLERFRAQDRDGLPVTAAWYLRP